MEKDWGKHCAPLQAVKKFYKADGGHDIKENSWCQTSAMVTVEGD